MGCTSIGGLTVRTIQGVQYLETEEELLQAFFVIAIASLRMHCASTNETR